MRNLLSILTLVLLLFSCGSDEESEQQPNILGTYTIDSGRDECPNTADNQMVDNLGIGVCINNTCTQITTVFLPDNTYTYEQIDNFDDGNITYTERIEEEGTYEIVGDLLRSTSTDGVVTDMTIVDNGIFLDWNAVITDNGCNRIIRFSR